MRTDAEILDVTTAADEVGTSTRRIPHRRGRMVALAIVGVLLAGAGWWWTRGGPEIRVSGVRVGGIAPIGEQYSFGVPLSVAGGDVELIGVDAAVSSTVVRDGSTISGPDSSRRLAWSVTHAPMGTALGPISDIEPVRDAKIAGGDEEWPASLVASYRSDVAGVYRIDDATLRYRSGPRTREVALNTTMCLLVLPADARLTASGEIAARTTPQATIDTLSASYDRCLDSAS